jgi:hypothetical protein
MNYLLFQRIQYVVGVDLELTGEDNVNRITMDGGS